MPGGWLPFLCNGSEGFTPSRSPKAKLELDGPGYEPSLRGAYRENLSSGAGPAARGSGPASLRGGAAENGGGGGGGRFCELPIVEGVVGE